MNWSLEDGVEVILPDEGAFLKIKETLTRIGIVSKGSEKKLFQTAHILHKKGRYYIVHFKLLFALDHREAIFEVEDWERQNTIAGLLQQWGLLTTVNPIETKSLPEAGVTVLSHSVKGQYRLINKYPNLGRPKHYN